MKKIKISMLLLLLSIPLMADTTPEEDAFTAKLNELVTNLDAMKNNTSSVQESSNGAIRIEVESAMQKEAKEAEERIKLLQVQKQLKALENEGIHRSEATAIGGFSITKPNGEVQTRTIYTVDAQSGSKQLDSVSTNERIASISNEYIVYNHGEDKAGQQVIIKQPFRKSSISTNIDGLTSVSAPTATATTPAQ